MIRNPYIKNTVTIILLCVFTLFSLIYPLPAHAGSIDWIVDKLGRAILFVSELTSLVKNLFETAETDLKVADQKIDSAAARVGHELDASEAFAKMEEGQRKYYGLESKEEELNEQLSQLREARQRLEEIRDKSKTDAENARKKIEDWDEWRTELVEKRNKLSSEVDLALKSEVEGCSWLKEQHEWFKDVIRAEWQAYSDDVNTSIVMSTEAQHAWNMLFIDFQGRYWSSIQLLANVFSLAALAKSALKLIPLAKSAIQAAIKTAKSIITRATQLYNRAYNIIKNCFRYRKELYMTLWKSWNQFVMALENFGTYLANLLERITSALSLQNIAESIAEFLLDIVSTEQKARTTSEAAKTTAIALSQKAGQNAVRAEDAAKKAVEAQKKVKEGAELVDDALDFAEGATEEADGALMRLAVLLDSLFLGIGEYLEWRENLNKTEEQYAGVERRFQRIRERIAETAASIRMATVDMKELERRAPRCLKSEGVE